MKRKISFFTNLVILLCFLLVGCKQDSKQSIQEASSPDNQATELVSKKENEFAEAKSNSSASTGMTLEKGFPKDVAEKFLFFKSLVIREDTLAIARLITYPMKRPNELLQDEDDFIKYYDKIFDNSLKTSLKNIQLREQDFIIKSDHYGILGGKMWFGRHSGKITSLRYQSKYESELDQLKEKSIKSRDHESIQGWTQAILRCETENFIIYLLQYPKGDLNYVSWNKPKTSADKPDLRLANGITERKGTMGGSTYSFNNGIWKYAIDETRMGPEGTNGFSLMVYKNNELVLKEKVIKLIE